MTIAETVLTICLALIFVKAFSIGLEFDLYCWYIYGKDYRSWYFGREDYLEFRARRFREQRKIFKPTDYPKAEDKP